MSMRATPLLLVAYCFLSNPLIGEGFLQNLSRYQTIRQQHHYMSYEDGPIGRETPEERQSRMEQVRKIQSSFYQPDASETNWLQMDPNNPAIIDGLPLWRVQWTELPGWQNVLNVHVAHYTHMFRKLILEHPKPWFFGSVYLPEGSANLGNPNFYLPEKEEESSRSQATLIGTLMQITDYREQDDGRLTLIVQGVGRFQIMTASQQIPYAVAKVKILADQESWEQHVRGTLGSTSTDDKLSLALICAAQDVAVREGEIFRDLEYHQTLFGSDDELIEVSPLSNINGTVSVDFEECKQELGRLFAARLRYEADTIGLNDGESSDEILLASSTMKLFQRDYKFDDVFFLEKNVWILMDRMIRLLQQLVPGMKIPVPAQILGLLPDEVDWPSDFQLYAYAEKLETQQTYVGTHTKSPFVWLSRKYLNYPDIRRASRLSYGVWIILSFTYLPFESQPLDLQQLLETCSITQRLQFASDKLKVTCGLLQNMLNVSD